MMPYQSRICIKINGRARRQEAENSQLVLDSINNIEVLMDSPANFDFDRRIGSCPVSNGGSRSGSSPSSLPTASPSSSSSTAVNKLHEKYRQMPQKTFRRASAFTDRNGGGSVKVPDFLLDNGAAARKSSENVTQMLRGARIPPPADQTNTTISTNHYDTTPLAGRSEGRTMPETEYRHQMQREQQEHREEAVEMTQTLSGPNLGRVGGTNSRNHLSNKNAASPPPPPPPPLPPLQMSWQDALRTLQLCLDAGIDIDRPMAVLSECALRTLRDVELLKDGQQQHQRLEKDSVVLDEDEKRATSLHKNENKSYIQSGNEAPRHRNHNGGDVMHEPNPKRSFPSWSVRSRVAEQDGSHNYIRLPQHTIADDTANRHGMEASDRRGEGSAASLKGSSALSPSPSQQPPEVPAFLASRTLGDALLLVSMEGGPRTVRRDATVLQCVADLLDIPQTTSTVSGVKGEKERVAEARRREISQIVARHRAVLMSQEVITKMTRLEHRNGRWLGAMKLLQKTLLDTAPDETGNHRALNGEEGSKKSPIAISSAIPTSSPMITTGIEIFSAANQWEVALKLIQLLPGTLWQEADVSRVLRGLSRAKAKDNWVHALQVFGDATTKHKVKMSAPSNVNHLLGMLGRAQQTDEAARIIEQFVKMDTRYYQQQHTANEHTTNTTRSGTLLPSLSSAASTAASSGEVREVGDALAPFSVSTRELSTQSDELSSAMAVEANAFTISQICVAFRHQWSRALSYAGAIIARNKNNPAIVDGVALAKLTMVCSEASLWQEGLRVVELSEEAQRPMDPASYAAIVKLIESAAEIAPAKKASHTAFVASCVRKHHSAAVFGKVINTIIQTSPLGLVTKSNTTSTSSTTTPASPAFAALDNSRAGGGSKSATGDVTPAVHSPSPPTPSNGVEVLEAHYQRLASSGCFVETATLHRLLEAHCHNGDWVAGLRYLDALRERCAVTSAAHDAVQYAMLEPRAPLPQPDWRVAVRLYDTVTGCDTEASPTTTTTPAAVAPSSVLGSASFTQLSSPPPPPSVFVPLSEIAFRSCMRLCFQQGAADAAQRLLRTTMKRGIGGGLRR